MPDSSIVRRRGQVAADAWSLSGAAESRAIASLLADSAAHWEQPFPEARVRLMLDVGITPEMVSWLLYYGARVQVLAPEWLRERVVEEHRRAAEVSQL